MPSLDKVLRGVTSIDRFGQAPPLLARRTLTKKEHQCGSRSWISRASAGSSALRFCSRRPPAPGQATALLRTIIASPTVPRIRFGPAASSTLDVSLLKHGVLHGISRAGANGTTTSSVGTRRPDFTVRREWSRSRRDLRRLGQSFSNDSIYVSRIPTPSRVTLAPPRE